MNDVAKNNPLDSIRNYYRTDKADKELVIEIDVGSIRWITRLG